MPRLPGRPILTLKIVFALLASSAASAQSPAPAPSAAPALPTIEQQIAAAVLPLPQELRDGAMVMGYRATDQKQPEVIRAGKNGMTCLALFAVQRSFHVACYQNGMEPFMARGRALRVQGLRADSVDSVRFREVKRGKIKMPRQAIMYQLFGSDSSWNAATGAVTGAQLLLVLYMPGATAESTGLSVLPSKSGPWIMYPGTPKAHMMLMGSMNP